MKAKELIKTSISLDEIYKQIELDNKAGFFKTFYPHWVNIADETKLRLMQDGFKIYTGEGFGKDTCLVIEW